MRMKEIILEKTLLTSFENNLKKGLEAVFLNTYNEVGNNVNYDILKHNIKVVILNNLINLLSDTYNGDPSKKPIINVSLKDEQDFYGKTHTAQLLTNYLGKTQNLKALITGFVFEINFLNKQVYDIFTNYDEFHSKVSAYVFKIYKAIAHEANHMLQQMRGRVGYENTKLNPKDKMNASEQQKHLVKPDEIDSYSYEAARELLNAFSYKEASRILTSTELLNNNLDKLETLKMYKDHILDSNLKNKNEIWRRLLKLTAQKMKELNDEI